VIELGRLRAQTGFNVAQTLAQGQLCDGLRAKLLGATEAAHGDCRHTESRRGNTWFREGNRSTANNTLLAIIAASRANKSLKTAPLHIQINAKIRLI
jgi:hypothetical protein